MRDNTQIPFHDLPPAELIAKLEVVKHKAVLDEDEAALVLNRSMNAIRALRRRRRIAYCKDGDRIQYEMTELKRYLNANRVYAFDQLSPAPTGA